MSEEERMIKYVEEIVEDSINNIEGKDYFEYIMTMNDIQAIQGLLHLYNKEKEKNNNILGLVFEYGQIDGEHHKTWVIDQIVRILTGNDYDKWVQHYEYDEETGEDYTWDIGIAP